MFFIVTKAKCKSPWEQDRTDTAILWIISMYIKKFQSSLVLITIFIQLFYPPRPALPSHQVSSFQFLETNVNKLDVERHCVFSTRIKKNTVLKMFRFNLRPSSSSLILLSPFQFNLVTIFFNIIKLICSRNTKWLKISGIGSNKRSYIKLHYANPGTVYEEKKGKTISLREN